MKYVIFILILLFLVFLWCLPAYMTYHGGSKDWGLLYLLVALLTVFYGILLGEKLD